MPIMEYYAGVNTLYMTLNIKQITKDCLQHDNIKFKNRKTNKLYIDIHYISIYISPICSVLWKILTETGVFYENAQPLLLCFYFIY